MIKRAFPNNPAFIKENESKLRLSVIMIRYQKTLKETITQLGNKIATTDNYSVTSAELVAQVRQYLTDDAQNYGRGKRNNDIDEGIFEKYPGPTDKRIISRLMHTLAINNLSLEDIVDTSNSVRIDIFTDFIKLIIKKDFEVFTSIVEQSFNK